jgi:hypothetical protein
MGIGMRMIAETGGRSDTRATSFGRLTVIE